MLSQLGDEAKLLAGGQSLIPLMKLRLSAPRHLVDLNFIPGTSYIHSNGALRLGAMTRHAEIAASDDAARIPILHDCAAGIADPQVRNLGTIGGSIAEADPTGDWAPVLLALGATVHTLGPGGERSIEIGEFIQDAYTTVLQPGELITEIAVTAAARAQWRSLHRAEALRAGLRQRQHRRAAHHARRPDLPGRAHLSRRARPDCDSASTPPRKLCAASKSRRRPSKEYARR